MPPSVELLYQQGYLSALDFHFAQTMGRLGRTDHPLALLAAAAACHFTTLGHVCIDIHQIGGQPIQSAEGQSFGNLTWPDASEWLNILEHSPLITRPAPDSLQALTPLIMDGTDRLYLARYWLYQVRLARQICLRMSFPEMAIHSSAFLDGMARLFSGQNPLATEGQRQAVQMGVRNHFSVISGGPGTGKTSTVLRILAILIEQAYALDMPLPRIQMMAPTGKAAARLKQSLNDRTGLTCSENVVQVIPDEATTIHRALKPDPENPGRFRHDIKNPLDADVVVVDEASMIDLALMTHLVEATPPAFPRHISRRPESARFCSKPVPF